MTSFSRGIFLTWMTVFALVSFPALAETKVHAGDYDLGHNCSVHVERRKGEVYEFFVEQKVPPMYTKVALDVAKGKVVSGPNLCGYRDHPKATIETRKNGARTAFLLDCGGSMDAIEGHTKLILNQESGKVELVSTKFAISRFSTASGFHLGPLKRTTEDFLCVSHGDESLAALDAVEKLHAMIEDRRGNEAAKVSERRVSGKGAPVVETAPMRSPAGWFSSPAH